MTPNRGFSLIEVMLATALMSVAALGLVTIMNNLQADQNGVKFRMDADTFNEELRATLSAPVACQNSFGGRAATAGADHVITKIFDGTTAPGAVAYAIGGVYGDRSINLKAMHLAKYVAGNTGNKAQLTLLSSLTPSRTASGPQSIVREINISADLDTSNNITGCIATAKMTDGIWRRTPSNDNNIFFTGPATGGLVGINTPVPRGQFDVAGDFRVATTGHRNMPMALVPNTEGGVGGVFVQGIGFNLEVDRTTSQWHTGGDGVNSGGGAILLDHGDAALRFFTIPSVAWAMDVQISPANFMASERMRITNSGKVGIGVTTPTHQLELSTDSAAKPGSGSWTIASDARLKDVGDDFTRGLEAIRRIDPVRFRYRANNALLLPTDREYVGVTAQNVDAAVPEAVTRDAHGFLHVTNDAVMWTMLNAIKELAAQNDDLRAQIAALRRGQ